MAKLKLISPWAEYYKKLQAFFEGDNAVNVVFDEDEMEIKIYVSKNPQKAEALYFILNSDKVFGDVKVKVTVIPSNYIEECIRNYFQSIIQSKEYNRLFSYALSGNEIFSDLRVVEGLLGFNAIYVVFDKKVIQYYTDNIADLHGVKSTLAEDIARDIFRIEPGVFFCTEVQ